MFSSFGPNQAGYLHNRQLDQAVMGNACQIDGHDAAWYIPPLAAGQRDKREMG